MKDIQNYPDRGGSTGGSQKISSAGTYCHRAVLSNRCWGDCRFRQPSQEFRHAYEPFHRSTGRMGPKPISGRN